MIAALALSLLMSAPAPRLYLGAYASDEGLPSDLPLHFAESDARELLATLTELNPDAIPHLVVGATPKAVLRQLERLAEESTEEDVAILFLSSHGDKQGAHLSGELLRWESLDAAIEKVRARVIVSFVDACQSGALIGEKGFLRGAPLDVSLRTPSARGRVFVTSSGATELSHESALLGGSPFTKHLISGLRGAADRDADGEITVAELYQHVYERTMASTLSAPLGPQRPRQRLDVAGAGALVLSKVGGRGATVRGDPKRTLPCWILDRSETRVLGEVRGGDTQRVQNGLYVIKCQRDDADIDVASAFVDQSLELSSLRFIAHPKTASLVKGGGAPRPLQLSISGAAFATPNASPFPGFSLGLDGGSGEIGWVVEGVVLRASDVRAEGLLLGGLSYRLPWWSLGHLDVGLEAGVRLGKAGLGAAIGQFVRLSYPLGDRVNLVGRGETMTLTQGGAETPLTLGFVFTLGLALPMEGDSGIQGFRKDN
ncbi:MAG: caspase family protein [Myxococcota bacterium]